MNQQDLCLHWQKSMAACVTSLWQDTSCSLPSRVCVWGTSGLRDFKLCRCINSSHLLNLSCQTQVTRQAGSWFLTWGWLYWQLHRKEPRPWSNFCKAMMAQCVLGKTNKQIKTKNQEEGKKIYLMVKFEGAGSKGESHSTGKGQAKSHCFLQDA